MIDNLSKEFEARLILAARSLRTDDDDSNSEYDRALVELSSLLLGIPMDEIPVLRQRILDRDHW